MNRALSVSVWRGIPLLLGAVALLLTTPAPASAQMGTIQGSVTDRVTGRQMVGVRIILVGTTIQMRTDVDGAFVFNDVPTGERQVQVLALGYNSITGTVTVNVTQLATLDFQLTRASLVVRGRRGRFAPRARTAPRWRRPRRYRRRAGRAKRRALERSWRGVFVAELAPDSSVWSGDSMRGSSAARGARAGIRARRRFRPRNRAWRYPGQRDAATRQ